MNLEGCEFLLTFKCVGKCRHCSYRASPLRYGVMSVSDFKSHMTVLANEQSLDWVFFSGGEPFLFYQTLKRCIEFAHKCGQKRIGVITSGYWGGSQANALTRLKELKKAGLSSVFFSVDAFHQEFVPFRSVRNAIDAARATEFEETVVTSACLGSVDSGNAFNKKTEEYLHRLRLPDDFGVDRHPLRIEGRAADRLASSMKCRAGIPGGECVLPNWIGSLKDPKAIEIDFLGNVTMCPGLCIGNAKTVSLSRIVREYDYRQHPIIKVLAENGPEGLVEMSGIEAEAVMGKYVSECHLCYELRRQLRARFPEILSPEGCYEEPGKA